MQQEVLALLAEARDWPGYARRLEEARGIVRRYEERLADGSVAVEDLIVSKRLTREPREYQKANQTAIAAQQLFGHGARLRPGQTVEYIITDAGNRVPNDRVRAYALWDGWFGYDRRKYAELLREAFEPLALGRATQAGCTRASVTNVEENITCSAVDSASASPGRAGAGGCPHSAPRDRS